VQLDQPEYSAAKENLRYSI